MNTRSCVWQGSPSAIRPRQAGGTFHTESPTASSWTILKEASSKWETFYDNRLGTTSPTFYGIFIDAVTSPDFWVGGQDNNELQSAQKKMSWPNLTFDRKDWGKPRSSPGRINPGHPRHEAGLKNQWASAPLWCRGNHPTRLSGIKPRMSRQLSTRLWADALKYDIRIF